jgi:hypothetical protein
MFTTIMYEAERTRTPREQREFNTRNGELALAIRRPFRLLRASTRSSRRAPRGHRQPTAQVATFACQTAAAQTRCS